jgi:gliding motility-associated-like protein
LFYYPGDTANYQVWLKVTTNYGCTDSTMRLVRIGPDILVFIPNAFTPGAGGPLKNEDFDVVASGFKTYNIIIFNRWGEILFESNDINKGWDGKSQGIDCQQDVYAYQVTVTSMSDDVYKYNGTVTLLR